jgi:hypothetical protein
MVFKGPELLYFSSFYKLMKLILKQGQSCLNNKLG